MTIDKLHCNTALACTMWLLIPTAGLAQTTQSIDVPAQPLAAAITELGTETGLRVAANADTVARLRSTAVSGSMTPMEALRQLLAGTGLSARSTGANGAVVGENRAGELEVTQGTQAPILLDEIVLEGTLTDLTVQETQDSVIVATGDELEDRGDADIYDLIERTPGVIRTGQQRGFAIRGVNQRGFRFGNGLTVATQVDGVTLTNFGTFDGPYSVWDLEQVEIFRGPQGTRQGRSAQAGAIILRSADPTFNREFRLRGELGQDNTYGAAFVANAPLIEDRLSVRLSGETRSTDGYVLNPTRNEDDFGEEGLDTIRAKLRWDPTPNVSTVLSFMQAEALRGSRQNIDLDLFPDKIINRSSLDEFEESEHRIFGLRALWDINPNLQLEAETSYYTLDQFRLNELGFTPPEDDDGTSRPREIDDTVFEQDLRLIYSTPGIEAVGGLFYGRIDQERRDFQYIIENGNFGLGAFEGALLEVDIPRNQENESIAVYGEATIAADRLLPGLSFVLGARYERENVTNSDGAFVDPDFNDPDNDILVLTAPEELKGSYDAFLPKAGIIYNWTENISTSFTYQRAFRPGNVRPDLLTGDTFVVDPELSDTFEFALRSQFLDNRLIVNANIFQTDYRDIQTFILVDENLGLFDLRNAGEARTRGVELQVEAFPTDRLFVYGAAAYLDTDFPNFSDRGVDFAGEQFTDAPEWTAQAGFEYFATDELSLGIDASFQSESFLTVPNDPELISEERFLVNAQINYRDGPFEAGLYVRNLLDESYVNDTSQAFVGEPRTIGFFAGYRF